MEPVRVAPWLGSPGAQSWGVLAAHESGLLPRASELGGAASA